MSEDMEKDSALAELYVLFRIQQATYAVSSKCVESMFLLEQELSALPSCDNASAGMISYRGRVLSIIDLRVLMGLKSSTQEAQAFNSMLEQRKHDHVNWVNELKRCLLNSEPFPLATDPHKCAFGKWYDSYHPESDAMEFHLKKIAEPHAKLHESALHALACLKEKDDDTRHQLLEKSLHTGADYYMPQVLTLLDQFRHIYNEQHRRLIMAISAESGAGYGIMVDEIIAVDTLRIVETIGQPKSHALLSAVAQRENDEELIFLLSEAAISSAQRKLSNHLTQ